MTFYHSTNLHSASKIVNGGFLDSTEFYGLSSCSTGVFISDEALSANEGADGDAILQIQNLPEEMIGTFEIAEDKRLRAAITGERGEAFVMLGLGTGAWPSELLALRWGDIDFGHGLVSITAALGQEVVRGPLVRKGVKTWGGARRVKVDPSFLAPLQGRAGAEDDYVFLS